MKTKPSAIASIFLCTICTSAAALMNKKGATMLSLSIRGTILNPYLLSGLMLLALASVLLIIALKGGDVSVIYPIIATSYVWVIILSYYIFGEALNIYKIIGVVMIVLGIVVLNLGNKEEFLRALGVKI